MTEALDRIRHSETEEESDMITKEERECTIASIQYNAKMEEREEVLHAARDVGLSEDLIKAIQARLAEKSK